MLITTTNSIENFTINEYLGLVYSNVVLGTNLLSDWSASFTDVFGGRSGSYQHKLQLIYNQVKYELETKAKHIGANCIIGFKIDFDEISGKGKSMFMVSACGTAVNISSKIETKKSFMLPPDISDDCIYAGAVDIEFEKHQIIKDIQNNKLYPTQEDWDFLTNNRIEDIADLLMRLYISGHGRDYIVNQTAVDKFPVYLENISKEKSIEICYDNILTDSTLVCGLIIKYNLFDTDRILELVEKKERFVVLFLLKAKKDTYIISDIDKLNKIVCFFDNLSDLGKIETKKVTLLSKEKQVFVCRHGHINNLDTEYCSECHENIKGLTESQVKRIEDFKERVSIITSLLKQHQL